MSVSVLERLNCSRCEFVCAVLNWHHILSVFPPHAQCPWDELRVHYPDQEVTDYKLLMKVSERYDILYLLTSGHMVCHMAYHGIRIES